MENIFFSALGIDNDLYNEYKYASNSGHLDNLARLNILVGENNSGKSRFLRKIFADEELKFLSPVADRNFINERFQYFIDELKKNNFFNEHDAFESIRMDVEKFFPFIYLTPFVSYELVFKILRETERILKGMISNFPQLNNLLLTTQECLNDIKQLVGGNSQSVHYKFRRIYIPVLRGLRPIQRPAVGEISFLNEYDNYKDRTVFDYFTEVKRNKLEDDIYTGLNLYDDVNRFYNGDGEERETLNRFCKFISETFFNNAKVELIPRHKKPVVYVKIGNHEEPIYNLGDGIQSLIILLYPVFFFKNDSLKVFIEEPETHLHPGFQRLLIETLLKDEFRNCQYFITTHSNHILDLTFDYRGVAVYTFEKSEDIGKKPTFIIKNVENTEINILALLGVRNSSVFLSNCTIWVEGITDRIYLRKYLEIIQKNKALKYYEEKHYSFVEYGGNNITHWSFLDDEDPAHPNIAVENLCGKLFLITDKDDAGHEKHNGRKKTQTKKMKRHAQLKDKLGDRYYCLECNEIENLLSASVLTAIIGENNIKAGAKIEEKHYKNKYLGKYLDSIKTDESKFASVSGAIANKVEFAKKAVDYIQVKEDISKEAIDLANKLYKFIAAHHK
ncbi:AAA family ATPase [Deminuibacter soli]|nr:AAA family ATPase [Deminuibacter soli]